MKELSVLFLALISFATLSAEVELMYYDRPPLFYTDAKGQPAGLMIGKIKETLEKLNYKVTFALYPPKRQFSEIAANKRATCGVGWFKNSEREKIGKFSHEIFSDEPLLLITHKTITLNHKEKLKSFFKRKDLTYLKKNGFSYGVDIDALEDTFRPQVHMVSTATSSIFEMVGKRGLYYTLLDRNEVDYIVKENPKLLESIHFAPIEESSKGNIRYLFCSFLTPDKFLVDLKLHSN